MSVEQTALLIEIPPDVAQQEVWDVTQRLEQVEGVTSQLQEPKDFITPTPLFIHLVAPHLGQLAAIGGGIKATHAIAKIIYDFLHLAKKEQVDEQGKNKVVFIKEGKRIELYNLSIEEIVKVLEKQ